MLFALNSELKEESSPIFCPTVERVSEKWQGERKKVLHDDFLKIEEHAIKTEDGREFVMPVVRGKGYSVVAALSENNTHITLVTQWRYAIQEETVELPAGVVEEGESPQESAQKELLEETGLESQDWTFLGDYQTSPGNLDVPAYLFLAKECRSKEFSPPDPDTLPITVSLKEAEKKHLRHMPLPSALAFMITLRHLAKSEA